MDIKYFFLQPFTFRNRNKLKNIIYKIFLKYNKKVSLLNIIFCDDEFLFNINKKYLSHDFYTDILTFDITPIGEAGLEIEIYISIERVRQNAANYSQSFNDELYRVIFHGILHMCGLHDGSKTQKALMKRKEDTYLKMWNVSRETDST